MKQVLFSEVVWFQEGPGVRNTQYTDSGVKLLNVANLVDGRVDLSNTDRYISEEEAYGKYRHFLVDNGDFIIASSGIKVEYFDKKMGFVSEAQLPLCMNTSTIRFKVLDKNILNIRYFMYFLKTDQFKQQLSREITGSAQLNFGPSHLKKMHLPLINLTKQHQIVATLDKVTELISKRRQQLDKLDEVEMFGDPESNDKKWDLVTIGQVLASCEAGWSGNGTQRERKTGEIAVLKVSAVTKGFFIPEECKVLDDQNNIKKYIFPQKGDLIFSRANTREMVGATAVIWKDYPELILPDKLWKLQFCSCANTLYMKYILSSKTIREKFSTASTGTSGSMYNVSMEKFKAVSIPLPPVELQDQFATFVKQTEKSRSSISCSLEKLETLKKALMQEYFG